MMYMWGKCMWVLLVSTLVLMRTNKSMRLLATRVRAHVCECMRVSSREEATYMH